MSALARPTAPTPTATGGNPALVILAFAALYLIWGSTYLAIRFAIETVPPFLMVGIRFLLAGALLYGWVAWRGQAARTTPAQWGAAVLYGTLFFLFGNGGVTWAETRIASGAAALVVGTMPFWTTMIEWIFGKGPRPTLLAIGGLAVGFSGVGILVGRAGSLTAGAIDPLGAMAC